MKTFALATSLILSGVIYAASTQDLVIDQDFTNDQINLEGLTYEHYTSSYTYWDTCYNYETRDVYVCYDDSDDDDNYSGGSSGGSSGGHTSGRGTRYRDRRDDRNKDELEKFEKGCYWSTRTVSVPYSCQQTRYTTVYQADGGRSLYDFNLSVVNPEIVEEPVTINVAIDTSESGTGRKLKYTTSVNKESELYFRKVKNELDRTEEDNLFSITGSLALEAVKSQKIKDVINAEHTFSKVDINAVELELPVSIYNKEHFSLKVEIERKKLIFYRDVETKVFKLSELEVKEVEGKSFVTIPFSHFPTYHFGARSDTYRMKFKVSYKDEELMFPHNLDLSSKISKLRFKRNFEDNTLEVK